MKVTQVEVFVLKSPGLYNHAQAPKSRWARPTWA